MNAKGRRKGMSKKAWTYKNAYSSRQNQRLTIAEQARLHGVTVATIREWIRLRKAEEAAEHARRRLHESPAWEPPKDGD